MVGEAPWRAENPAAKLLGSGKRNAAELRDRRSGLVHETPDNEPGFDGRHLSDELAEVDEARGKNADRPAVGSPDRGHLLFGKVVGRDRRRIAELIEHWPDRGDFVEEHVENPALAPRLRFKNSREPIDDKLVQPPAALRPAKTLPQLAARQFGNALQRDSKQAAFSNAEIIGQTLTCKNDRVVGVSPEE